MQLWDGAHAFFRGNEEKVQAALTEHLQWRAASPHPGVPHVDAIPVALVAQELGAGSLYVHGHDTEGRAVLHVHVSRHWIQAAWYDKRRLHCAIVWVCEQALHDSARTRTQALTLAVTLTLSLTLGFDPRLPPSPHQAL